jgi:DNA-binding transcriptional LysR family regulator
MTLEQLRIFVTVARLEHVTRAAERLNLTQSAVSAAIAALEGRHKVTLFDRVNRRIVLTGSGRLLLGEAEAILARVEAAQRLLDDLSALRAGRLVVAASQTVANYWLPPRLDAFARRHPGVAIESWAGNSTAVAARILAGEADLGLIEQDSDDAGLHAERVANDTLAVVVGRRHPWFGRPALAWADLPGSGWVMREPGSGTRALFEAALRRHGIDPATLPVTLTLHSGEAVRSAVEAGTAAAFVSDLVAAPALAAGTLHRIPSLTVERGFHAIRLKLRRSPRAVEAFLDLLRD